MDKLTPSYYGNKCLGIEGKYGLKNECTTCKFYKTCFPDIDDPFHQYHHGDRRDFWNPDIRDETCLDCKYKGNFSEGRKKYGYCNKTKRYGRELRGLRCLHFEKLTED